MVFNTTFNNISVISWWSVLLVEESGVPGENHRPAAILWKAVSNTNYSVLALFLSKPTFETTTSKSFCLNSFCGSSLL